MDWIFISTIAIFFVIGVYKGAIATLFSFLGGWAVVILAYFLCGKFSNILQNSVVFNEKIPKFIEKNINALISGEFSSVEELKMAISAQESGKYFLFFILLFTKNIEISGRMTAGQILSPQISVVLIKITSFAILFAFFLILIGALTKILSRMAKAPLIRGQNRFLGGLLGILRGLFYFLIFYGLFTSVGGLIFSKNLISVAKNGAISDKLYKFISKKIINLFY